MRLKVLGPGDGAALGNVAPDVFDERVRADLVEEFLDDPRHHVAVALDGDLVVGFASAVHYVHPDKDPELWINEVGVAPTHQGRGMGRALMQELLALGRGLGCVAAWVLTERDNVPALRLYASVGGKEPAVETVLFTFEMGGDPPG